jgi:hypothetical protein
MGDKTAERLATIIDAKAMELLAAPQYAGEVTIRIDAEEEQCLLALLTAWSRDGNIDNIEGDNLWRLWVELTLASGERDTAPST